MDAFDDVVGAALFWPVPLISLFEDLDEDEEGDETWEIVSTVSLVHKYLERWVTFNKKIIKKWLICIPVYT